MDDLGTGEEVHAGGGVVVGTDFDVAEHVVFDGGEGHGAEEV